MSSTPTSASILARTEGLRQSGMSPSTSPRRTGMLASCNERPRWSLTTGGGWAGAGLLSLAGIRKHWLAALTRFSAVVTDVLRERLFLHRSERTEGDYYFDEPHPCTLFRFPQVRKASPLPQQRFRTRDGNPREKRGGASFHRRSSRIRTRGRPVETTILPRWSLRSLEPVKERYCPKPPARFNHSTAALLPRAVPVPDPVAGPARPT